MNEESRELQHLRAIGLIPLPERLSHFRDLVVAMGWEQFPSYRDRLDNGDTDTE